MYLIACIIYWDLTIYNLPTFQTLYSVHGHRTKRRCWMFYCQCQARNKNKWDNKEIQLLLGDRITANAMVPSQMNTS